MIKIGKFNILFLMFTLLLCFQVHAQTAITKIAKIEIDGKRVMKKYKVLLYSAGKIIEAKRTKNGFVIPDELKNEQYLGATITFGKYKLAFPKIHISKFNENWIIGVDKKPFSNEIVKPEESKTAKRAYYIQFSGNGLATQLVIAEN